MVAESKPVSTDEYKQWVEGPLLMPPSAFLLQDDDLTSAVPCIKGTQGALRFETVDPIHGLRGLFTEE